MNEKKRHESLVRLLEASKLEGPAALASVLNESEQTVTNWGRRGVSKQGAIKAQSTFGCNVDWILYGKEQIQLVSAKFLSDTSLSSKQNRQKGQCISELPGGDTIPFFYTRKGSGATTFAEAIQVIANLLLTVDEPTRRRVMSVLADLATDPSDHERIAKGAIALIESGKRQTA